VTEHPPIDLAYETQLETQLLKILKAGPKRLQGLVAGSEGAYPTDVLAVLRRLEGNGNIRETEQNVWVRSGSEAESPESQRESGASPCVGDTQFPEPHPLDFDWRFAGCTLDFLDRRIEELTPASVAVLGAPTLFKRLVDRGRQAHLFDRNAQIVQFLERTGYHNVTQCDLFRYSPEARFECVVADPPWYLDHYRAFLGTAHDLLVSNGKLLLSVLPRLTRPSAEADRLEIMAFASQWGFDLVSAEPASLHYLSPPFETEALKTEGLNLATWRLGDLYTFVRSPREVVASKPEYSEDQQLWHTFNVGPTVVKVKWDGSHSQGSFDFKKVPGAGGTRLRSVSRRSSLRSGINLWTSRNIALHVSRPDLVCEALQLLVEDHNSGDVTTALMNAERLGSSEVERLNDLLAILINEANG
jgi:hypothetical protein